MGDNNYADNVGQDKQHKDGSQAYDADHGTYKDNIERKPGGEPAIPGGPTIKDPSPFSLGGIDKG